MVTYRKLKYVIVPIIKDTNKRVSDRDNNRPICMSNVFIQIVEKYCTNGCKVIYICIYGVSRRTTDLIPSQLFFSLVTVQADVNASDYVPYCCHRCTSTNVSGQPTFANSFQSPVLLTESKASVRSMNNK